MKITARSAVLSTAAICSLAAFAGAGGLAAGDTPYDHTHDAFLDGWPERSRLVVQATIEKYGLPNRMNRYELVWYDNAPWRRTVVHRESWSGFLGSRDGAVVEQTIGYRVPDDKKAALKRFGKRISVDEAAAELTSRAETENMNFLALNLAGEIAGGTRTVKDARDFYAKTVELSKAGKSSAYLEGFVLPVGVE
ncbi:MAG: hypothetical protein ACHQ49_09275 [Elusimicrobiota bacterium]